MRELVEPLPVFEPAHKLSPSVVNLGDRTGLSESGSPAGVTVTSLSEELGKRDDVLTKTEDRTVLELEGLRLNILATGTKPAYSPDATVQSMMAQFDADQNGYLEPKELMGQQAAYLRQAFIAWDDDNDGKAYPDEMKKAYMRGWESQWRRVSATILKQQNSLFAAIDANTDGRRGAREMRYAAAPPWFVRMDRDGDGDLSLREFLGSRGQFHKLDANDDGFIDPEEAAATRTRERVGGEPRAKG